jgi:glutathione S-transferase
MEKILTESPWLAGRAYSLAEVNSYSAVAALPRLYPEVMNRQETPRSIEWLERMNARPAVQAALAMPNLVPETLRAFGD